MYIDAIKEKLEQMAANANLRIIWFSEIETNVDEDAKIDLSFIVVKL